MSDEIRIEDVFVNYPQLLEKFRPQLRKNLISFLALEIMKEGISIEDIAAEVAERIHDEVLEAAANRVLEDVDVDDIVDNAVQEVDLAEKVGDAVSSAMDDIDMDSIVEDNLDNDTVRDIVTNVVEQKIKEAFDR